LALRNGVIVANSPGTIDNHYRGELKVILINTSSTNFIVNKGDRIAQIKVAPFEQHPFLEVQYINDTERGDRGFGSTGV